MVKVYYPTFVALFFLSPKLGDYSATITDTTLGMVVSALDRPGRGGVLSVARELIRCNFSMHLGFEFLRLKKSVLGDF